VPTRTLPPTPPTALETLRGLASAVASAPVVTRIAVVGNAPLQPSAERAVRIDGADLVVRMTTFATDSGTARVGRRTDVVVLHRAIKPGPATFARYPERLYLLAEPGRLYEEVEALPRWWPADLAAVPVPNGLLRPLLREVRSGGLAATWPTTGTITVFLMRCLFPAALIELSGSSLLRAGRRRSLAHGWGDAVPLTPEHRLRTEARLYRRWSREPWFLVDPEEVAA
jgi:hypothetical protein